MAEKKFVNKLFYGDNLQIMQDYIDDESIDLIYLDPPFNSNRSYNVLFKDESGEDSKAQIEAFDDTWHWNESAEETYYNLINDAPPSISSMIGALREFIGTNQMMAYLVMMTIRLLELHRVLKVEGNLFLHCDPTAGHYLKIILDTIFGVKNFRNEIIWRRTGSHNSTRTFGQIHDTILFYSKTNNYKFNIVKRAYMKGHVESRYTEDDQGRLKFTTGGNILTGSGTSNGESGEEWRGFDPTAKGRHWAIPSYLSEQMPDGFDELGVLKRLEKLYQNDLIEIEEGRVWPMPVKFLQPNDGQHVQDIWAYQPYTQGTVHGTDKGIDEDVSWLGTTDPERLGYQTQKPLGILERIIKAGSNEGDLILDPFCGCGTAIAGAEKLNRKWIGIDITHLSISLQKYRLKDMFGIKEGEEYQVIGEPTSVRSAEMLANNDRYQFEWWALSLVEAKPTGGKKGSKKGKKGKDKGIDGIINFIENTRGKINKVLVQVKSGKVGSQLIRDLRGTLEREKAAIGVFITLNEPTKDMKKEALEAGYYKSKAWGKKYSKIQILTIEELLDQKSINMPPDFGTFKKAQKEKKDNSKQGNLGI